MRKRYVGVVAFLVGVSIGRDLRGEASGLLKIQNPFVGREEVSKLLNEVSVLQNSEQAYRIADDQLLAQMVVLAEANGGKAEEEMQDLEAYFEGQGIPSKALDVEECKTAVLKWLDRNMAEHERAVVSGLVLSLAGDVWGISVLDTDLRDKWLFERQKLAVSFRHRGESEEQIKSSLAGTIREGSAIELLSEESARKAVARSVAAELCKSRYDYWPSIVSSAKDRYGLTWEEICSYLKDMVEGRRKRPFEDTLGRYVEGVKSGANPKELQQTLLVAPFTRKEANMLMASLKSSNQVDVQIALLKVLQYDWSRENADELWRIVSSPSLDLRVRRAILDCLDFRNQLDAQGIRKAIALVSDLIAERPEEAESFIRRAFLFLGTEHVRGNDEATEVLFSYVEEGTAKESELAIQRLGRRSVQSWKAGQEDTMSQRLMKIVIDGQDEETRAGAAKSLCRVIRPGSKMHSDLLEILASEESEQVALAIAKTIPLGTGVNLTAGERARNEELLSRLQQIASDRGPGVVSEQILETIKNGKSEQAELDEHVSKDWMDRFCERTTMWIDWAKKAGPKLSTEERTRRLQMVPAWEKAVLEIEQECPTHPRISEAKKLIKEFKSALWKDD